MISESVLRRGPLFGLILAVALSSPCTATAAQRLSLQVESKTIAPSITEPGVVDATFTLVNGSQKTITAWTFGCVVISQLGRSTVTAASTDSYQSRSVSALLDMPPAQGDAFIPPGARVLVKAAMDPRELDGPFAAKSCGPVVVIFEDATFEGDSATASRHFEARAEHAVDAWRAYGLFGEALAAGTPVAEALELVRQSQPEGIGFSAVRADYELAREGNTIDAPSLLRRLNAYHLAALEHLPSDWKDRVEKEMRK